MLRKPTRTALLLALLTAVPNTLLTAAQLTASAPPANLPLNDRVKTLNSIFTDYWEDNLKHNPELASSLGDKRYNDQLSDFSVQAYNDSLARGRVFLGRLGEVDTAGMPDQQLLSKELLLRLLVQEQEEARFKPWEMPVTQFGGLQLDLPQVSLLVSFDSAKDYDDYIARLKKAPLAFQQITDCMSIGMDDHREPPAYLLEKALTQVNNLASQKPEDSPFASPIKKFPASVKPAEQQRIREELLAVIGTQVLPAYVRFGKFLKAQYIPQGRNDPGLWSLPDGDAYYRFLVKQSTTTELTPDQIHQIGLDEVKRDEEQLAMVAKKLGFSDVKALRAAAHKDPKLYPTSKDQLLNAYRRDIDQIKPRLPELFGRLPKAPLIVQPVPEYTEKEQAPAYYLNGTPDGSRPGTVFVNTYKFETRPLYSVDVVFYHEGLPGHHLQISISQELTGLPEFRKNNYYTAYTEGWGLYAEQLGKDIGLYQDPWSDYGRLEMDIWRGVRLVVDTGVHSKHWTRQQMVDFFHDHANIPESDVQAETDRYVAIPSQALGYKIGQLELLKLRTKAKTALGDRFDLRAFHDQLLDSGALPMDLLGQRIDAWIASVQHGAPAQPSAAH